MCSSVSCFIALTLSLLTASAKAAAQSGDSKGFECGYGGWEEPACRSTGPVNSHVKHSFRLARTGLFAILFQDFCCTADNNVG